MCGFIGCISASSEISDKRTITLRTALSSITHRGPDNSSIWHDRNVFLGHNRLSIIDVSAKSNQPILSDCKRYIIVFNGEIYNYKDLIKTHLYSSFPTVDFSGDTITLLYLYKKYGKDCLQYLNGMFSFAIIDLHAKHAFFARDRFGEKPFYYYKSKSELWFGSEIKVFESVGLTLSADLSSINYFSHVGTVPQPHTIYKEVKMLPASCYAVVDFSSDIVSIKGPKKYWDLLSCVKKQNNREFVDIEEKVQEQLVKSISSRLVSDVPVGLFLSGGLDSSSILSTLKYLNRDITCITCDVNDPAYSELGRTSLTAKYYGYPLKTYSVTPSTIKGLYPSFIDSMDQPTVDGMNNYLIASYAKINGHKVWLNGTGGDELFGGYPSFYNIGTRIKIADYTKWLKLYLTRINKTSLNLKWSRLLYLLLHPHNINSKAYFSFRSFIPANASLVKRASIDNEYLDELFSANYFKDTEVDDFQIASFYETNFYLTNQLLRDADNFSMQYSIELRPPFLDHELYELVFPLPARYKLKGSRLKPLLVDNLKKPLPDEIIRQKKSGFGLPQKEYLLEHLAEVKEVLMEESINIWDKELMLSYLNKFKEGKLNFDVIWMPYVLNTWLVNKKISI